MSEQPTHAKIQRWLDDEKEELAIAPLLEKLGFVDDPALRQTAAHCLLIQGLAAEALEILAPLLPCSSSDENLLSLAAKALAMSGDPEAAYSCLQPLFLRPHSSTVLLEALTAWALAAERPDLARLYLEQLDKCGAALSFSLLGGELLTREQGAPAAVEFLQQRFNLHQTSRRFHLALAEAHRQALHEKEALQVLQQAAQRFGLDGHVRRGLIELARHEPALSDALALLEELPDDQQDALFFYQKGLLCFFQHQWHDAEDNLRHSLLLDDRPGPADEPFFLLVELLRWFGTPQEVRQLLEHRYQAYPSDPPAAFALAQDELLNQRWLTGWPLYEKRHQLGQQIFPFGLNPTWRGEPVAGKYVLVLCEQGLGDAVMVSGLLQILNQHVKDWKLVIFPQLAELYSNRFGPGRIITEITTDELQLFDCSIGLNSLPALFHFGSRLQPPLPEPILKASPVHVTAWDQVLSQSSRFPLRIGFAWFGGGDPIAKLKRSMTLLDWLPLLQVPEVSWISLQYGGELVEAELSNFSVEFGLHLQSYPESSRNLAQQAALCKALDLVISVDQTLVHLAGAINTPVWVLLPYAADWRYGRTSTRCAWYSSMRLFRQQTALQWGPVVQEVKAELNGWVLQQRGG